MEKIFEGETKVCDTYHTTVMLHCNATVGFSFAGKERKSLIFMIDVGIEKCRGRVKYRGYN